MATLQFPKGHAGPHSNMMAEGPRRAAHARSPDAKVEGAAGKKRKTA